MKTCTNGILMVGIKAFFFNGIGCFVASVVMALGVLFTGGKSITLLPSLYAMFMALVFFGIAADIYSVQQSFQSFRQKSI